MAYLPVNLVVIAAMVHWHARVLRPWLRVMAGLVGFTLAIAAVPLVRCEPLRPPSAHAPGSMQAWSSLESHAVLAAAAALTAPVYAYSMLLSLQLDLAPASSGTLAALLLLVAACGVCDGLAQGALFGEAALLPPRFTQALVAGTAVSGGRHELGNINLF